MGQTAQPMYGIIKPIPLITLLNNLLAYLQDSQNPLRTTRVEAARMTLMLNKILQDVQVF